MAYPIASEHPSQSTGPAGSGYIPTIYAARMLAVFYLVCFLTAMTNTDYEGELKKRGDKVIVRTMPEIEIKDYVIGEKLEYEAPHSEPVEMVVDKGKYWGFRTKDVEKVQSDLDYVADWTKHAGIRMKEHIEAEFLEDVYTGVHAANMGTTAGAKSGDINLGASGAARAVSKATIIDLITDCGVALDEQNIPREGRWIILPAKFVQMVKLSDLKDASLSGDTTSPLRNGRVGVVDGMEIFQSNMVHKVTDGGDTCYNCLFGCKAGISFAAQIEGQPEVLRDHDDFGYLHRGQMIYGYKVIQPTAVGNAYLKAA